LKTIYAILIAYNPDIEELHQAVDRLKAQVDVVVVCNNSNDDMVFEDKNVKFFNFEGNLGIAKAQTIGMKWAFENGADFVLQMDQDSIPSENLVSNLLSCYLELENKGYKVGLVGPQDFDKVTKELNKARLKKGEYVQNTNYVSLEQTLSSGSLIPKGVYEVVGGMDDGLFIDAVDSEYCWRIRKNGFLVIKNNNALLAHRLGEGKKKILGFMYVGVPSPIRHYYQVRNTLLLVPRNYVPLYWKISGLAKIVFKLIIYPLCLNSGRQRLKYITRGISDGLKNKYGKYIE